MFRALKRLMKATYRSQTEGALRALTRVFNHWASGRLRSTHRTQSFAMCVQHVYHQ